MARVPYTISPIDSNKTILELLKEIQTYLVENRIFKIFDYPLSKRNNIPLENFTVQGYDLIVGDIVIFNDGFIGRVNAIVEPEEPDDPFGKRVRFQDFIDMRGAKGDKGDTGVSITRIVKTSSSGLVDTYTIYLSDDSTSTFTVTNGERGEGSSKAITSIDTSVGVANVTYDSEDGATIESSGTVTYDDGSSDSISVSREIPIVSSDEIVFDATEDNAHVSAHLNNEISSRIQKSLITPMSAPSDTKLVAIDTSNAQTNISVGDGLSIENGTLKASGGSGGSGFELLWEGEVNLSTSTNSSLQDYLKSTSDYTKLAIQIKGSSDTDPGSLVFVNANRNNDVNLYEDVGGVNVTRNILKAFSFQLYKDGKFKAEYNYSLSLNFRTTSISQNSNTLTTSDGRATIVKIYGVK